MRVIYRTAALIVLTIIASSCENLSTQRTKLVAAAETPAANPTAQEKLVEYEGVSFRYDPAVFGTVKSEIVPVQRLEEPDHKPESVAPEHVHFTFDRRDPRGEALLSVYPVNEFPKVYSVNPEFAKLMRDEIEGLKRVLTDASYRVDGQIPHLPYRDASDIFYAKVRHVSFVNGKGILFVAQWQHGVEYVSNRTLEYRFEGLTSDGKYYVTAETPIRVQFLPDESPEEMEGLTWKELLNADEDPAIQKKIDAYVKDIAARMEGLGPADFQPRLEAFEAIIASLKVGR